MIRRFPSSLVSPLSGAALLASALLLATAGGAQETPAEPWIGHSVGLVRPAMTYLGQTPVLAAGSRLDAAPRLAPAVADRDTRRVADGAGISPQRKDTLKMVALNATTGETYRIEAPRAAFERLHLEMVMRGEASGRAAAEEGPLAIAPRGGWSDGEASIWRKSLSYGWPANDPDAGPIGQIDNHCSGALIGARHVLTAAHCFIDNDTHVAHNATFRPRRDDSLLGGPHQPFGQRSFVWYYFPEEYWDGTCAAWNEYACNQYDFAVGILSSNMAAPTLGYWYASASAMNGWDTSLWGYPRCSTTNSAGVVVTDPDAPSSCAKFNVYEAPDCEVGDWKSLDGDGWNRELFVACDAATGMDGGPMVTRDSPAGDVPVALGVYSQYMCLATTCDGSAYSDHPNVITRITPEYAQLISWAKSTWSCASGTCS